MRGESSRVKAVSGTGKEVMRWEIGAVQSKLLQVAWCVLVAAPIVVWIAPEQDGHVIECIGYNDNIVGWIQVYGLKVLWQTQIKL